MIACYALFLTFLVISTDMLKNVVRDVLSKIKIILEGTIYSA